MKLSSIFLTTLSAIAVTAVTALGFSSQAQALNFTGVSSGTWGEPTPGSINSDESSPFRATYTGVGSNFFTWGDPSYFQTPANHLMFTGNNSISAHINSLFKIGDLTYHNGSVPLGTNVESVPLNLRVSLAGPINIDEVFNFDFRLINTENLFDDPWDNADYVYPLKKFGDRSFTHNGRKYTIELTGFRQNGGATSVDQFHVLEGDTATAAIFARVTTVPPIEKVPEPGAMAGLSLVGIYLIYRQKSTKA